MTLLASIVLLSYFTRIQATSTCSLRPNNPVESKRPRVYGFYRTVFSIFRVRIRPLPGNGAVQLLIITAANSRQDPLLIAMTAQPGIGSMYGSDTSGAVCHPQKG